MDLQSLLDETTTVFRKGAEVEAKDTTTGLTVIDVYAYPHYEGPEAAGLVLVDLHFVMVGVDTAKAKERVADLREWLDTYPDQERLAAGPSYIEFAGVAGIEQEAAFRVFALGDVLDLWDVIIPSSVGITGAEADELAGEGMVYMTGYAGAVRA